jgi:hypothetical protein
VQLALENAVEYYDKILRPKNKKKCCGEYSEESDSMSDMDECLSYDSDGCPKKPVKIQYDSEDEYYFSIFEGGPVLLP